MYAPFNILIQSILFANVNLFSSFRNTLRKNDQWYSNTDILVRLLF